MANEFRYRFRSLLFKVQFYLCISKSHTQKNGKRYSNACANASLSDVVYKKNCMKKLQASPEWRWIFNSWFSSTFLQVQGFIYGVLSILALLAHNCQLSMRQYKLSYLMYVIYFRGNYSLLYYMLIAYFNVYWTTFGDSVSKDVSNLSCNLSTKWIFVFFFFADQKCGPVNWNIVADIPPPYEPIWPAITTVAFRTNILALIYLVLSSIWIVTSLMLIGECSSKTWHTPGNVSHENHNEAYSNICAWCGSVLSACR